MPSQEHPAEPSKPPLKYPPLQRATLCHQGRCRCQDSGRPAWPRGHCVVSRGGFTSCSDLWMLLSKNLSLGSFTQGSKLSFPSPAPAWHTHTGHPLPALQHGGGHGGDQQGPHGRPGTTTAQCPHPAAQALCGSFCTAPGESCWEELQGGGHGGGTVSSGWHGGGTASSGWHSPGHLPNPISAQTHPKLLHPAVGWPWGGAW